jgi:hypothetical protein
MRMGQTSIPFLLLILASSMPLAAQATPIYNCADRLNLAAPRLRVAAKSRTPLGPMLVIHASLDKKYLNESDLVTMACHMRKEYANETEFLLLIFDDYQAARRYNSQGEGNSRATADSFRAEYSFDNKTKRQQLRWRPSSEVPHKWVDIALGEAPGQSARDLGSEFRHFGGTLPEQ